MADDVEPWDALYLEIGRIAQSHVRLDATLRRLFIKFAAPSLAMHLVNESSNTSVVIKSCRTMLKHAGMPPEVLRAGLSALDSAQVASVERNRVVHDMWMPDVSGDLDNPRQWHGIRNAAGTYGTRLGDKHDLVSIRAARSQIVRAIHRVEALVWALDATLPFFASSGMPEVLPLEDWIAVMEDRFDVDDSGGVRPHTDNWPQGSLG